MSRLTEALNNQQPNYIFPFFWQHGESEAVLCEYVKVIHEANLQAFCVESRPHEDFLGPKWWRDMDIILDEAQRRDMQIWILVDKHFPTGYAAGAVETAPKELCHQYLDYNSLYVAGPMPQVEIDAAALAHPKPTPPWMPPAPPRKRVFHDDQLYAVIACPVETGGTLGEGIDLTADVHDGKLTWDVPPGYFQIFIIYLTRDADGRNDYINMLDEDSCRLLVDAVYEPHFAHYGHLFGTTIAGFFSDEPPIGNSPGYTAADRIGNPQMPLSWSRHMPEAMAVESRHLPLLWAQGTDAHQTAWTRTAYMDAVTTLVSRCFSEQLGSWCEKHQVEYIGHMLEDCDMNANLGPSMGHFFRGLSGQHMAGIDNIGGQVLIGGQHVKRRPGGICEDDAGFYHYTLGKLGASMAVVDPKKKGRCMLENFGAYGWQTGVSTEKYLTDHFLARGINRFVPHAFSPKEFPDPDCPPHFYAHGENPQYRAFGELMRYTNRVSHLIDGGRPVLSVALLYHGESRWAGDYESNIKACRALTTSQYGFAMVPADVFAYPKQYGTRLDGKHLFINGIQYDALVISDAEYIPTSVARFAMQALHQGFPVIMTGNQLKGISDESRDTGDFLLSALRPMTICSVDTLASTLAELGIQSDVQLTRPFVDLTVYHYRSDADYYLLLNESHTAPFEDQVVFPTKGKAYRYAPLENVLLPLTDAAIRLEPLELCVIVIGEKAQPPFQQSAYDLHAPAQTLHVHPLFDEIASLDDFSGFLRYETAFGWDGEMPLALEIERFYDTAEVFLNRTSIGMMIGHVSRLMLPEDLLLPQNKLTIEVATTLERKARSMGIDVACMNLPAPRAPIGIVGEVRLFTLEKENG